MEDKEVLKIAKLSYLKLDQKEIAPLGRELNSILSYVEQLNTVNVDNVAPLSHVHGSTNVLREDIVEPSMPTEKALAIAPDISGKFFRVPLVVES